MRALRLVFAAIGLVFLTGCDLAPVYERPPSPVPQVWPVPPGVYDAASYVPLIGPGKLHDLVERALAGNRDLRASVAAAASAHALYRVQHSQEAPTLSGDAGVFLADGGAGASASSISPQTSSEGDSYALSLGINAYEVDLFGRLRNLSRAAFDDYLSSQAGVRAARLTVAAGVANAAIDLAADEELLALARSTVASGERALDLTRAQQAAGLASGIDVQNAATILEQARSDEADEEARVVQDRDALQFVVGQPLTPDAAPVGLSEVGAELGETSAGLSSDIILRRPDVLQAEDTLRASGARIGAARAAFFPTITLTSGAGLASAALSSLLTGGAASVSFAAAADVPLLGGPTRGNLAYAKAQRSYALAQYQKMILAAFRDVGDGLARRATIGRQLAAQGRLVAASDRAYQLALDRFRAGEGSFLTALIDQRTLYAAERTRIAAAQIDLLNRVALAQALGLTWPA